MDQDIVGDYIRFAGACPVCGGEAACWGGQVLVRERLEWSIEADCPACGPSASCGSGGIPDDLRERLIGECGPGHVDLPRPDARAAVVMKVIRAGSDLDLSQARGALQALRSGQYTGTMPEIELLARRLRAAGVAARAVRS
ncbi:hypothetical protein ACFZB9_26470 [Kitasatospora sp. NPDC008050]|uniref:hypothetical protein n=1 Tax=Kitasatospora sp. NPDC008050 TaxID=3364021 RepID=UPI0036E14308